MDSVVTQAGPEVDERFDTARITAAIDALAAKHAGREDVFRAVVAQLLKAEMIAAKARHEILDIVYSPEGVKTIKADCRRASTHGPSLAIAAARPLPKHHFISMS